MGSRWQVTLELQHLAQHLTSWKLLGNEFLLSDLAYMVIYAKQAAGGKHKPSEVGLPSLILMIWASSITISSHSGGLGVRDHSTMHPVRSCWAIRTCCQTWPTW